MAFTTIEFVIFLAFVISLYYLIPKKAQWGFLLLVSYIFYFVAGEWYFPFILLTTLSSYFVARLIEQNQVRCDCFLQANRGVLSKEERKACKAHAKKKGLRILLIGLTVNFGTLAVLKYTGFAITNINAVISLFGARQFNIPSLILPLGISFFTFQSMGYLIDVYREKSKAEKNIFRLALFVSFFPQLVQGPISRYSDLSGELFAPHKAEWENLAAGVIRICFGYLKKLVIADRVMVAVRELATNPENYGGAYTVFLIIIYSIEIYADFTGGIDIAVGIARMLGIRLRENFDRPFASTSTKEYWKRWHISLGAWFTDYVFYPLSISKPMQRLSKASRKKLGNKIGKRLPVYISTIATWFLTGLWHGARWSFIVWGLSNCFVILLSQELATLYSKLHTRFPSLEKIFVWTLYLRAQTFMLVGAIRLFDCYRDVRKTFNVLGSIFYDFSSWRSLFGGGILSLGLDVADFVVVISGVLLILAVSEFKAKNKCEIGVLIAEKPLLLASSIGAMILAILIFGSYGIGYEATEFIYTQF